MVSKVNPRSLGCFSRGGSRFLILIWGRILASWESGVKRFLLMCGCSPPQPLIWYHRHIQKFENKIAKEKKPHLH